MSFVTQLAAQRKQLEDDLKKVEEHKLALEKQLTLLKSGFKDVSVSAGTKRKQPAAAKPSSKAPKVQILDSDAMWKTCERILSEIKSYNKEMASWFLVPVKREVVPDYYNVVKVGISFEDIERKLKDKKYQSPIDFRDDVRLMWDNCRTYNRIGTAPRCAGDTLSEQFERKWAMSMIEEMLAVRDAQDFIAEVNMAAPSDTAERVEQMKDMAKRLAEAQAKIDRYYSDENFMSFEDKRKLSISLGNLPGDLLTRALEIVIECMKRTARPIPADGEVEIDIDELDKKALQQLQKLCNDAEKKTRKAHGAPAKTTQPVPGQGAPALGYGLPAQTNAPHHASQSFLQQQAAAAISAGHPVPAAFQQQQAADPVGPSPSAAANIAHPGHGLEIGMASGAAEAAAKPPPSAPAPAGLLDASAMPPPPVPGDAGRHGGVMERAPQSEDSSSGSDSEDEPEGKGTMAGYGGHAPITQVSGNVRGAQPQIVKPVSQKKEPTVNTDNWANLANADGADPFSTYEPPTE